MGLSVVITAHNSQEFISDCIKSVAFAEQIIVIDNESSDLTASIAEKLGAQVIAYKNNPAKLNESKNFGFTQATQEWILSLDTDERLESQLAKEIQEIISVKTASAIDGYLIPRHNVIFGQVIQHGLWYPDYQLRLFRRGKGKFPNVHNHELLQLEGQRATLQGHIEHQNYQSISQYLQKIDKTYSPNEVDAFLSQGKQVYWYDAIRFPMQDFLSNYFLRKAYKDGLHGLVLSILQAFYMFIVFAKIWEKQGFKEKQIKLDEAKAEFTSVWKQLKYWYASEKYQKTTLKNKIVRKIITHL